MTERVLDEASASYPGWRVLACSVLGLALSPGPAIFGSFGLFAPHLSASFGWNRGQIMLSLTLLNLGAIIASPMTGKVIDKVGARIVLIVSLLLFMGGFVAMAAFTTSLTTLYIIVFLWGALTVGTQSITYAKLLTSWFRRFRGLSIGVAAAGLGVGYTVVPLLVAVLLAHMQWPAALCVLAAIIGIGPLVAVLLFATMPDAQTAALVRTADNSGMTAAEVLRNPSFWVIAIAIFLMSTTLTGIVPHLVLIATDQGFAPVLAATVASSYGIATIVGRLLVGTLTDRFPVSVIAMIFFGLAFLGFVQLTLLLGSHAPTLLYVATVTLGLGFGAESDLLAIFISNYFGLRAFGAIYGYLLAAFGLGAAVGPPLLGFGRDYLGGYGPLMAGAAVISAVAILLLTRLPRRGAYATRIGLSAPSDSSARA